MTDERKKKISEIRNRLAALSPIELEAMKKNLTMVTIEGRSLSAKNQMLIAAQSNEKEQPTVLGGYRQWQRTGKQVKRGEHGYLIFIACGPKDNEGDIKDVSYFAMGTVFDISQTEPVENKPKEGVIYALTGGHGDKCISNGNTWEESRTEEAIKNAA